MPAEQIDTQADKIWNFIVDVLDPILGAILVVLAIVLGIGLKIYLKKKSKPKKGDDTPLYVREVPDGWTPGEMCPLFYYFDKKKVYLDDSISATILDLARKGYIEITDDDPDDQKLARIKILKLEKDSLKTHEGIVLELLESVSNGREWFQMEEFESYIKNNEQFVAGQIKSYNDACEKKIKDAGYIGTKSKAQKVYEKIAVFFLLGGILLAILDYIVLAWSLFLWTEIGMIALGAALSFANVPYPQLTKEGEKIYFEFHALEDFLKDFSSLDEHSIPALSLWNEYMVYATAMGIAEVVSKNMDVKYSSAETEEEKIARENGSISNVAIRTAFSNPIITYMFARAINVALHDISKSLSKGIVGELMGGFINIGGKGASAIFKSINRGLRRGGGKPPWRR